MLAGLQSSLAGQVAHRQKRIGLHLCNTRWQRLGEEDDGPNMFASPARVSTSEPAYNLRPAR
jgi:hypothetical protein